MPHALILAAGSARRLHATCPKALLPVAGQPLVGRLLDQLFALGFQPTVVTGHRADEVERALSRPGLSFVRNPIAACSDLGWSAGVGLAAVLPANPEMVLLVLGDTVTETELFRRVLETPGDLVLGLLALPVDEESMKVATAKGRPVLMGKGLGAPVAGEFSGVARLSLRGARVLAAAIASFEPTMDLCEGPLNRLLGDPTLDCRCVDVSDIPWIEIDFPEDVERMQALFAIGPGLP